VAESFKYHAIVRLLKLRGHPYRPSNAKTFVHLPQAPRQMGNLGFTNPNYFFISIKKLRPLWDVANGKHADPVKRRRFQSRVDI
jgi:hypothetical protein